MKKQIYLFLIILLTGCSQNQSAPTLMSLSSARGDVTTSPAETSKPARIILTKTSTPINTPVSHLDRISSILNSYFTRVDKSSREILLKNGQWYVYGERIKPDTNASEVNKRKTRIVFTSIDHPDIQNEFIVSGDFGFSDQNWGIDSPASDSSNGEGFLMPGFKKDCIDQNFVVVDESNGQWNGPYYYGQPSRGDDCYGITWSEDGSQLAVYDQYIAGKMSEKIHMLIFNKKAELLKQFDIQLLPSNHGFMIKHLSWKGTDFLIWTTDDNGSGKQILSRFYSFSSLRPEKITHLVDLAGEYFVIGKEPGSNRLLITSFRQGNYNTLVFNPDKKQIEKKISFDTRCYNDERSSDNQKIAIVNQKDDGNHLLIWNWGTLTFQDKGIIKWLLSWQSDLQGFLVEKQDNQQKLIFDVIRP
jgi:hypothetical protein